MGEGLQNMSTNDPADDGDVEYVHDLPDMVQYNEGELAERPVGELAESIDENVGELSELARDLADRLEAGGDIEDIEVRRMWEYGWRFEALGMALVNHTVEAEQDEPVERRE